MRPAAADAPPAAKRPKKSHHKAKQHLSEQAVSPHSLHDTKDGAGRKTKKQKRRQQKHAPDQTVAEQPDAPGSLPLPLAAPGGEGRVATGSVLAALGGKKGKGGGSLLQQMRARLQGGRFRWLNETLYTSQGKAALEMMQQEPGLMEQYHEGFREQTKGWPVQPVDQAIRWLRGRPAGWAVADLGCGDAKIAAQAAQAVHSFDLTPTAPGVVACNMADVPLPDASVDAAIFCLSLMGTDYGTFLEEAARLLKPSGWLWIAEVQSRFVDATGSSVLPSFLAALARLGFALKRKDVSNSHFLMLELQREPQRGGGGGRAPEWPDLRACQYKKR